MVFRLPSLHLVGQVLGVQRVLHHLLQARGMAARRAMSGCSPGAGLARTVAARKARALSGLMTRPAPRPTPPAVPNGLPSSAHKQLFPKPSLVVELARALSGLMARPAPRITPPAVPNGLPERPRNNFS